MGKKIKQEAARLNWTKTRLSRKYPYPTVLSYSAEADCDFLQDKDASRPRTWSGTTNEVFT